MGHSGGKFTDGRHLCCSERIGLAHFIAGQLSGDKENFLNGVILVFDWRDGQEIFAAKARQRRFFNA